MAHSDQTKRPGILKLDSGDVSNPAAASGSAGHTPKSVSLNLRGEHISPLILGGSKDVDELDLDRPRLPRVKSASSRRLSGKVSVCSSASSINHWNEDVNDLPPAETPDLETTIGNSGDHHSWVRQIAQWIKDEKLKREARHARHSARPPSASSSGADLPKQLPHKRTESTQSVDLEALEQIIKDISLTRHAHRKLPSLGLRRKLHHRTQSHGASSDTEYFDGDTLVPSAEVVLDNSMTLLNAGGVAQSTEDLSLDRTRTASEEAWLKFKAETLRLIHTLRLKGWRRVPLDMSPELTIERLSGALTNAVYVVSPPEELPTPAASVDGTSTPVHKRAPAKLLLRIYGPQVEHLIDRRSELQILARLARKHIGPRMLGTFVNGRFEEYFNAAPLTLQELRNPDTSRHIAKRMRELHDGMDLLPSERADGPFVWRNWDKWLGRVNKITLWLDKRTTHGSKSGDAASTFVCGTPWAFFHDTVFKYRKWLEAQLGGAKKLSEQMVFAHNDTQYGNILRIIPSSTSPLLLPANSHKQLIVIDFEYANANTPGFEFANHFSEWCYNYHDPTAPWRCNHNMYPTPEEQTRFLRAYVRHRPDFNISTPLLTPTEPGQQRPGSITNLISDARGPPTPAEDPYAVQEEASVKQLVQNTRMWRMAASAQWVAWGIVQARVPGMPTFAEDSKEENAAKPISPSAGPVDNEAEAEAEANEEEFDYLAYARDRAMLFWGDALEMGFVTPEQVPEDVRRDAKRLKY